MDKLDTLDFEAEPPEVRAEDQEEGEVGDEDSDAEEGEVHDKKTIERGLEGLEDGELKDEDDMKFTRPEDRPVCKFFHRGQCTWGSSCRFLHPGVIDKGNYSMFAPPKTLIPMPDHESPRTAALSSVTDQNQVNGGKKGPNQLQEPPVYETAWERAIRLSKERLKKASERKEHDIDFEVKRFNLSIGQDEPEDLEKESSICIARPPTPVKKDEELNFDETCLDESDRLALEAWRMKKLREKQYEEGRKHRESDYYTAWTDEFGRTRYRRRTEETREIHQEGRKEMSHVRRVPPPPDKDWKDGRSEEVTSVVKGRGDEWSDPWMRARSPGPGKGKSAGKPKKHPGSHSSHSSRGSSRSSSYSSYSRSSSRSSASSLSRSRSRSISKSPPPRKPPVGGGERQMKQNMRAYPPPVLASIPPPTRAPLPPHVFPPQPTNIVRPTPLGPRKSRSPPIVQSQISTSPDRGKESRMGIKRKRSASSSSHSPARSPSASSSTSNSSSASGSSGSSWRKKRKKTNRLVKARKEPAPPGMEQEKAKPKIPTHAFAPPPSQATVLQTSKGIDPLKASGQKQQIKLTLKPSTELREKLPAMMEKVAPPIPVEKVGMVTKSSKKTVVSRREELLKQLKAVEDAIARKRSKLQDA